MHRAEILSLSEVSRVEEEKHVTEALQRNGYPASSIRKNTGSQPSLGPPDGTERHTPLTLPYFSGLSESLGLPP